MNFSNIQVITKRGLLTFFSVSLFIFQLHSQKSSTDTKDEMVEIQKTIENFFEGFHNQDTTAINRVIDKNLCMQTIVENKPDSIHSEIVNVSKFLAAVSDRPSEQTWYEKILEYKIDNDERLAQVWTPYEFYVNNIFSHCGVNMFQLYYNGSTWKIMAIADTRVRDRCSNKTQ